MQIDNSLYISATTEKEKWIKTISKMRTVLAFFANGSRLIDLTIVFVSLCIRVDVKKINLFDDNCPPMRKMNQAKYLVTAKVL